MPTGPGPIPEADVSVHDHPLYSDSRHLVVSPRHPHYQQMMRGDDEALKLTR